METISLVSKDLVRKTIVEDIDLKPLKLELAEINKQLADLEKEPNEITAPNDSKFGMQAILNSRKAEISKLLNVK